MTDLFTERSVTSSTIMPGAVLPRGHLQRRALAVPGPRPSVGGRRPRALRAAGRNDTATRQDYVAILERADQGIGQILEALKRRGLDRNTLVIYMQDNGGEWLSRNAPLFHRKDTVWEGGIRVPAILRWPGHLPAGKVSGQVGIVQDLTASILAARRLCRRQPVPRGSICCRSRRTDRACRTHVVLPLHAGGPAARGSAGGMEAARRRANATCSTCEGCRRAQRLDESAAGRRATADAADCRVGSRCRCGGEGDRQRLEPIRPPAGPFTDAGWPTA